MSQDLLEVATRHAIVPYPMERKPCDTFYDLLDPLLVPLDRAKDGDLVGIGFPLKLLPCGTPVFDTTYPIPEIISKKFGSFAMSSDEDLSEASFSPLMRALKEARTDPSFLTCGVTAIKKLLPQLPDDGQHKGFLAWQFNGFVIGDCWTHDITSRSLIHHFPDGSDQVTDLLGLIARLISHKRDGGAIVRTMRRD